MPRYKFQWANLPARLLTELTASSGVTTSQESEVLRSWYGAKPGEEFIRENWDSLRDQWLGRDTDARQKVVERLWNLGVGEGRDYPGSKEAEMVFLRSCRNARRLRELVLEEFTKLGERAPSQSEPTVTPTMPRQPANTPRIADAQRTRRTSVPDEDLATRFMSVLPADRSPIGNIHLRSSLGLEDGDYRTVAAALKELGYVTAGRGRGGSLAITDAGLAFLNGSAPPSAPPEPSRPVATEPAAPQRAATGGGNGGGRSGTITLAELESRLWAAANALRGPVDPADFKTYVFPMLFWKWISDTWEYEHAEAVAEWGDDLIDEIEADLHRFDIPDGSLWAQVTNGAENLGAGIAKALQRIEQANPRSLAGIFGDATWANKERLPEASLLGLIKAFNETPLNPATVSHDLLGAGYEYLLKNFADESGKKAGEFFTPREVVNLLVGILEPEPEETIYDPACGSGGMLVNTINQVREHGKDQRTLRLYGQEVNLTTASIARMNLFLHEIEDFDIKRGDTLRAPAFKDQMGRVRQFDVVITNPPFSLKGWGADRWPSDPRAFCGVPPAKNGDFAWVQHMISSAKPGTGRVGVVMPHGVLFRGGEEGRIRRCLIQRDLLEAVVGLPANLFYSTSIPACLLIFRHQKTAERRGHVLFIDGSARFVKGRNQNTMSDADIKTLIEAYRTGQDPDHTHTRLVPLSEIESNSFDLHIGRYIKVEAEDQADLPKALAEYQAARAARIAAEQKMFEVLTAAGIETGDE